MSSNSNLFDSTPITRRDFLKSAAGLTAKYILDQVPGLTADWWQPKVAEVFIDLLQYPRVTESLLVTSAERLENFTSFDKRAPGAPGIEKNDVYKPMYSILKEVLKKHKDKPLFYERTPDYQPLHHYLDITKQEVKNPKNRNKTRAELYGQDPRVKILGYYPSLAQDIIERDDFFPPSAKKLFRMSKTPLSSPLDLIRTGSGLLDRFTESSLGKDIIKLSDRPFLTIEMGEYWDAHRPEIEKVFLDYFIDIRKHIENIVSRKGSPVSAGEIFDYCLQRNNWCINKSIFDTTLFLKYMARNSMQSRTITELSSDRELFVENEKWFQVHILDEYGPVGNYVNLPHATSPYVGYLPPKVMPRKVDQDLSLLNHIGRYHPWNLLLIIYAVPPVLAQVGALQVQFDTFYEQGTLKTAIDARASSEFTRIDQLLMSYAK